MRLLSLSGLTAAEGNETRASLAVGFTLSTSSGAAGAAASSASASQPFHDSLSLDLNFFLQVADTAVTFPIMPL